MTLLLILTLAAIISKIMLDEWRSLTRTRQWIRPAKTLHYTVKLGKAKSNERRAV